MIIDKITPPKYFVGDLELTEYDVRNIQLEVAKGNISHEDANSLNITDENGVVFNFREDGCLKNIPKGYDLISRMVLDMIGIRRSQEKNEN